MSSSFTAIAKISPINEDDVGGDGTCGPTVTKAGVVQAGLQRYHIFSLAFLLFFSHTLFPRLSPPTPSTDDMIRFWPSRAEIRTTIRRLRNKFASGPDDIPQLISRECPDLVVDVDINQGNCRNVLSLRGDVAKHSGVCAAAVVRY